MAQSSPQADSPQASAVNASRSMSITARPVTALSAVTLKSLAPATAVAQTLEVFLLGTGPRFEMVPPDLRGELLTAGLTVEAMDTGAACRTYNVLLAEGRAVAAALIAVD